MNLDPNLFTHTSQWVSNINYMHRHYGHRNVVESLSKDKLKEFVKFRLNFLKEELSELESAIEEENSNEVVDALIDICVVAIGTLDLLQVNCDKAWSEVNVANMSKVSGKKEGRENPFDLPDLLKPPGWKAPSHVGNYGLLNKIYEE